MKNAENLISKIRRVRVKWQKILSKSKESTGNARISTEIQKPAALKHNQTLKIVSLNGLLVTVDPAIAGLAWRFESLREICNFLKSLDF
jgi:hypothetical protein